MDTTHHEHRTAASRPRETGRSAKVALAMAALIGAFYLLREHWNHVAGAWICLLLLACPLRRVTVATGATTVAVRYSGSV